MIKISISKGQTAITFEADGHELKAAMGDAYELFKQINDSTPTIPFEKELEVKNISPEDLKKLNEEELDVIEEAKRNADLRRKAAQEETAKAVADIAKADEAKAAAKAEAAKKAAEEQAKKDADQKVIDDAENQNRADRAKARKKRSLAYQMAEMDDAVTSEMIAQAKSDEEEAEEDAAIQAIYDQVYAEKPAVKAPEVKEAPEVVETPAIIKPAEKVVEAPKEKVIEAPKVVKTEAAKTVETEVEKTTEVEVEKVADVKETKESAMGKIQLMFSRGAGEQKQAIKFIRNGMELLKSAGLTKVEAMVEIMTGVEGQEQLFNLMSRRPEVLQSKLNLSKQEAQEVIDIMK